MSVKAINRHYLLRRVVHVGTCLQHIYYEYSKCDFWELTEAEKLESASASIGSFCKRLFDISKMIN